MQLGGRCASAPKCPAKKKWNKQQAETKLPRPNYPAVQWSHLSANPGYINCHQPQQPVHAQPCPAVRRVMRCSEVPR